MSDRGVPERLPSPRAREVLILVLAGHENEDIARELGISIATVKTHRDMLVSSGYLPPRRGPRRRKTTS